MILLHFAAKMSALGLIPSYFLSSEFSEGAIFFGSKIMVMKGGGRKGKLVEFAHGGSAYSSLIITVYNHIGLINLL